jgi:myo-inositol-1(or 4)-monophosphatase
MAAALILEEAGGRVTGMDGAPWVATDSHILGTNGHLHEEMVAIIRDAR